MWLYCTVGVVDTWVVFVVDPHHCLTQALRLAPEVICHCPILLMRVQFDLHSFACSDFLSSCVLFSCLTLKSYILFLFLMPFNYWVISQKRPWKKLANTTQYSTSYKIGLCRSHVTASFVEHSTSPLPEGIQHAVMDLRAALVVQVAVAEQPMEVPVHHQKDRGMK